MDYNGLSFRNQDDPPDNGLSNYTRDLYGTKRDSDFGTTIAQRS
jgi:hypothetical protein